MSKQQLFQKYRPTKLKDIVGHTNRITQIESWIEKGFPQSIYISGETGRGKTTLARIIAMSVNCTGKDEKPCGECESCLSVKNETFHLDIKEINASNMNVDAARELDSESKTTSFFGGKKVWIINEFQELSDSPKARKNLLELLENKNNNVHTIITTMDDSRTEKAIKDRCAQIQLRALTEGELITYMLDICEKENIRINDEMVDVLLLIAQNSGGSVRAALTILDDIIDMKLWSVTEAEKELSLVSQTNLLKQVGMLLEGNSAILNSIPPKESLDRIKWILLGCIKIKLGADVSPYERKMAGNLPELFSMQRFRYVMDAMVAMYERPYIDSFAIQKWVVDCLLTDNALQQVVQTVKRGRSRGV